ncbi:MAG: hypothetical protein ACRED3_03830 [Bradyrhizobium sp.]
MAHTGQHAIVIGASMGGLLAARALSDFYAVVTDLEVLSTRLLRPAIVMRVLRGNFSRRRGNAAPAPAGVRA